MVRVAGKTRLPQTTCAAAACAKKRYAAAGATPLHIVRFIICSQSSRKPIAAVPRVARLLLSAMFWLRKAEERARRREAAEATSGLLTAAVRRSRGRSRRER